MVQFNSLTANSCSHLILLSGSSSLKSYFYHYFFHSIEPSFLFPPSPFYFSLGYFHSFFPHVYTTSDCLSSHSIPSPPFPGYFWCHHFSFFSSFKSTPLILVSIFIPVISITVLLLSFLLSNTLSLHQDWLYHCLTMNMTYTELYKLL